jgi:hypothetical protein
MRDYTKIYDIESKTEAIISEGEVINVHKHTHCPYVWFGKIKEQVESGSLLWVAWNMRGVI